MDYAVQQALSRKADDYEVRNLEQKIRQLENENETLKKEIGYIDGKLKNHYYVIERLLQMLIDSGKFSELESDMYLLINSL